jgi:uncharacterized membrane protein
MEDNTAGATPQLGKHRIEALADGIFAVAMTLLVIELRLPEHLHHATQAELAAALGALAPTFFSWVISFIVLAIFWTGNHRLYSHVRHVDGKLLAYTMLSLAGASLMPFASAINNQFASQLAQLVYSSVMIVMAAGALLVASHLYRNPQLCAHAIDRATWRATMVRILGLMLVAAVAVPLAGLFPGSANFAFLLLFGLNPVSRALARRAAARAAPAAPAA